MSDMANELRAAIGWQVGDVPVLIHAAADRIEALEAENTRLKLALGQIQRRESPDAGKPWLRPCTCGLSTTCMWKGCKQVAGPVAQRFDEYGHYGENNRPLPPMEGKE